jgi:hypothetical protein
MRRLQFGYISGSTESTYEAIRSSPVGKSSLLIITWDEHGASSIMPFRPPRWPWETRSSRQVTTNLDLLSRTKNYREDSQCRSIRRICGPLPDIGQPLGAEDTSSIPLTNERRINEFSHGMRVKLALTRAFSYRPRLHVLDEPFSGLDPLVRNCRLLGNIRVKADALHLPTYGVASSGSCCSICRVCGSFGPRRTCSPT